MEISKMTNLPNGKIIIVYYHYSLPTTWANIFGDSNSEKKILDIAEGTQGETEKTMGHLKGWLEI